MEALMSSDSIFEITQSDAQPQQKPTKQTNEKEMNKHCTIY
jgi:hypothetical protein